MYMYDVHTFGGLLQRYGVLWEDKGSEAAATHVWAYAEAPDASDSFCRGSRIKACCTDVAKAAPALITFASSSRVNGALL